MVNQTRKRFRSGGSGDAPFPPRLSIAQRATVRQSRSDQASHCDFGISSRAAKLTPTAYHAALVVQTVDFLLRRCNLQGSVLGGDSGGVVSLGGARLSVVQVDGFTESIIPGVESSSVVVKFTREDQLQFWLFTEGGSRHSPTWSIRVGEASVAWKFRDLES